MKVPHAEFEQLLRSRGMTKKAFSEYARIPYYTVAGWKKSGFVPGYAMVLLRHKPMAESTVSAGELIEAGLDPAVVWNVDRNKPIKSAVLIVSILKNGYSSDIIKTLEEFFGRDTVMEALVMYRDRVSDALFNAVVRSHNGMRTA